MHIPAQFISDNEEHLALVVSVSGGKDSPRMLGFLRAQFPATPTYCVMADTGLGARPSGSSGGLVATNGRTVRPGIARRP